MSEINQEQRVILAVLSNALFGNPLELPVEADWDALLRESMAQAVFPTIFQTVQNSIPEETKKNWEKKFLQYTASNIRVSVAHANLHRLLTEHDIPYVILKGCASARYYPSPELRVLGDVDFLVGAEDLKRCSEILTDFGMRRTDDGTHRFHQEYICQNVVHELHWSLPGIPDADGEKIESRIGQFIADRVYIESTCGAFYVPDDFCHGLLLLLHTASHITSAGVGLRHLCDWIVFANGFTEEDFCSRFEGPLKEIGLWEFAKILTALGERFFGMPLKKWAEGIDGKLLDDLMADVLGSGNFGSKDHGRLGYSGVMREIYLRKIKDHGMLWSFASLMDRKAKELHPKLSEHLLLRPFAWSAVVTLHVWRILTGKRPPVKLRKEMKSTKKRRELYQQLRLFEQTPYGE